MKPQRILVGVPLCLAVTGLPFSAMADGSAVPERRPLAARYETFAAPARVSGSEPLLRAEEPTGVITLDRALALALRHNPELAQYSWAVRTREAEAVQAGLKPNPELLLELEEFGGSGDASGLKPAETTLSLSQLFERAGKRAKRARVATLEANLAGWDYEAKRLDVATEVFLTFVGVLGAQKRVAVAGDLLTLADGVLDAAHRRVEAGKVSPLEETRARVAQAQARITVEQAEQALLAARQRLAATWGSLSPAFDRAEGELERTLAVPPFEVLTERLEENPAIARWETEIVTRQASLDLARAAAVSDVTVGGGVRRFGATGGHAFVLSIGLALPISDRNQGGILAAQARLAQATAEQTTAVTRAVTELHGAYRALTAAHARVEGLRTQVLPGARQVFDTATEGYREGKFDLLFVLDAQRTFFESRAAYVEALLDLHTAAIAVERAIGQSLDSLTATGPLPPVAPGGTEQ